MTEKAIIAFAGVIGAGKTTVGNLLIEQGYRSRGFADLIKEVAQTLFPQLTEEQLYGSSSHRSEPTPILLSGLDPETGEPMEPVMGSEGEQTGWVNRHGTTYGLYMTARDVTRTLGSSIRRLSTNVWVDRCLDYIDQSDHPWWVITDCRFPNEIEAIRQRGGIVVRMTRKWDEALKSYHENPDAVHITDRGLFGLPDSTYDYVLDNRGPLSSLPHRVEEMMSRLPSKFYPQKTGHNRL